MLKYTVLAVSATMIVACSSATVHNDCDNGNGGSASALIVKRDAGNTPAVPCIFSGSVKLAECHDAQLGSVPYCGRDAVSPFDDCVSPGIGIGDDTGIDEGWVWFCCPATHLLDGGAFP